MASSRFLIVVAIDYSEVSYLALRGAVRETEQHAHSELHAVLVESLTLAQARPQMESRGLLAQETSAAEPLARFQAWLTDELSAIGSERECDRRIIAHAPSDARGEHVSRLAAELDADLVVVGINSSNAWAKHVAFASTCSVLLVRHAPTRTR